MRRYLDSPYLGILVVPGAGNSLRSILATGLPWAADNAAFSNFDPAAFCGMAARLAGQPGCRFVACPDMVGDAAATLRLFDLWQPVLAQLNLPVALVGQDGAERLDLPWDRFSALFLGGSTAWKLGPSAARLAREAKRRGKWVHLGRCNTRKRMRHAFRLGCDSIDGSGFSRWPDERLPLALRWLAGLHGTSPPPRRTAIRAFLEASTANRPNLLHHPAIVIDSVTERHGRFQVHARLAGEPEHCPACGADGLASGSVYRHGTTSRLLVDVPREGKPVALRLERQRYRCRCCGRTFLQPVVGVPDQGMLTQALQDFIIAQASSMSATAIARAVGVHEKTIRNLLADVAPGG